MNGPFVMTDTSTPEPLENTNPGQGVLDCPNCDRSILGDYSDLLLHFLDSHLTNASGEELAANQSILQEIKQAQLEVHARMEL